MNKLQNEIDAHICKFRKLAQQSRHERVVMMLSNENDIECKKVRDRPGDILECIKGTPAICCGMTGPPVCKPRNVPLNSCMGGNIFEVKNPNSTPKKVTICEKIARGKADGDGINRCKGGEHFNVHEPKNQLAKKTKKQSRRLRGGTLKSSNLSLNGLNGNINQKNIFKNLSSSQLNGIRLKGGGAAPIASKKNMEEQFSKNYLEPYDYGHNVMDTTVSQSYFKSPIGFQPFMFDYHKIFNFKQECPEKIDVDRMFVDELGDVECPKKKKLDVRPNLTEAVDQAAKSLYIFYLF